MTKAEIVITRCHPMDDALADAVAVESGFGVIGTHCPSCGEELVIQSLERMLRHIDIDYDPTTVSADYGVDDLLLDTSTTVEYFCKACLVALPDRWQAELDRLLGNERDKDDPLFGLSSKRYRGY